MTGIIEAHAGPIVLCSPGVERYRFGAAHVGFETAEPEYPGFSTAACANRDAALPRAGSTVYKRRGTLGHAGTLSPETLLDGEQSESVRDAAGVRRSRSRCQRRKRYSCAAESSDRHS